MMNNLIWRRSAATGVVCVLACLLFLPGFSGGASWGANWYVNDTSTVGDSYTTATGLNTNAGSSPASPFRDIPRALQSALAGDTIFVDAGIFDSYVNVSATETAGFKIDTDNITIIGKDSAATVIDPAGANSLTGLYGIYASGRTNLFILNLGVTGAYRGIDFENTDLSTIRADSVCANGQYGIYINNGSDTNTVSVSTASNNSQPGVFVSVSDFNTIVDVIAQSNSGNGNIRLFSSKQSVVRRCDASGGNVYGLWLDSANNNTVDSNLFNSNSQYGIFFNSGSSNTVYGNTCNSNSIVGIYSSGGSNNLIAGNIARLNTEDGMRMTSATGNIARHNYFSGNTISGVDLRGGADSNIVIMNEISGNDTGVMIQSSASSNVVSKNNIIGNTKGAITNPGGIAQTLTRNWFGSTDSAAIGSKISDTRNAWTPYRLTVVDTRPGADTTAPKAPDTVSADGDVSDTSIIVEWTAVTALEENNGGNVALSEYRIFRSTVKDTSSWVLVAKQPGIRYQDTDVVPGRVYYYRVAAFDTQSLDNQSFFSDSQPGDSAPFTSTVNWYVNDSSTTGDSYTYAAGSDTAGLGTASKPFKSIPNAIRLATAGDTVFVDAGYYDSYMMGVNGETVSVSITRDSITLFGKDSASTTLNPPGDSTLNAAYGVMMSARNSRIVNIGVIGAQYGIIAFGALRSSVEGCSVSYCGSNGFVASWNSETLTISGSIFNSNLGSGVRLNAFACTVTGNTLNSNVVAGVFLDGGGGVHAITNNSMTSNVTGVYMDNCKNNTVSGNTIQSSTNNGMYVYNNSDTNIISNNTVQSSASHGFLLAGASGNTFTGNTATGAIKGFGINTVFNSLFTGNTATSNSQYGFELTNTNKNVFSRNVISSNLIYGLYVNGADSNNTFVQNTFDSNLKYQIYLPSAGSSEGDTYVKNNFNPSPTNPDSGVYNNTGNSFDFTRNFWNRTDSASIGKMVFDQGGVNRLKYQPFRLGLVDTSAGADTTAPKAPDTVAATGSDTSIIVEWTTVTALEEVNGGAVGLSGYRVYRSDIKDTSSWIKVAQQAGIRYQDTDVQPGRVYYYRVTAFDTPALVNESFFSDSQPSDSAPFTSTLNWYVNDASTTGDSFTFAVGSDITGLGTAQKPFKSIPQAMRLATTGDTLFIDAGIFDSYVVVSATETAGITIDKDSITLVGKDSNATVIDPPGANSISWIYGIYATNRVGLLVKNLGVTGAKRGIFFNNVDFSTLSGDSVSSCGDVGIIISGCDTFTVSACMMNSNLTGFYTDATSDTVINSIASSNSSHGLDVTGWGHTISNNTCNSNASNGVTGAPRKSTISGNTCSSNGNGFSLNSATDSNTFSNNTAQSNTNHGFTLGTSTGNTFSGNLSASNQYGMSFDGGFNDNILTGNTIRSNTNWGMRINGSSRNTVSRNVFASNALHGIYLMAASVDNVFIQNTLDSNTKYQIYLEAAAGTPAADTFLKNNVNPSPTNPDSGVYNSTANTFDFTRNFWGRADSASIGRMLFDTALVNRIKYSPFRLATVDTAAGADTTAPKAPDTVAVVNAPCDTSIILEWSAVTAVEEAGNGGAVALSGYRVYRSAVKDTSVWVKITQVGSGVIRYQDTNVAPGTRYYYRVTAFDTSAIENESFLSDSQPFDSAVLTSTTRWYVNDTSMSGDSFTTAAGSDASGAGNSISSPFRSITKALSFATAGDTVFIDAGTFPETVVIGADSISLIGKDSASTIVDPPGANSTSGLYGIYATGRTGLLIKSLAVTDAYDGIRFDNVDRSTLQGDSVSVCGNYGIYLLSGSDTNTVASNAVASNNEGIYLSSSSNNTVTSNTATSNSDGIYLNASSNNNTVTGNTATSNASTGIYLYSSSNNTVASNTATSNLSFGIWLNASSNNNTVTGNTANSNSSRGINLNSSSSNAVATNTANLNTYGIWLESNSNNNTVTGNTTNSNNNGIWLESNSNNNTVTGNTAISNNVYGVYLNSSSDNLLVQNDVRLNTTYQIYFAGSAATDTFQKNNIQTSATNPDSGVYNSTGNMFDFMRNYWNSTDSSRIVKMIFDTSAPASPSAVNIKFSPYRLSLVDTASGADTTAPKAPDTVAAAGNDTSIIVEWTAVTALEEVNGGAVGLSGYRVYRSDIKDTSSWIKVAQQAGIRYQDTDVQPGRVYYYRVTAFDTPTLANESFFSDSQPSDSAPFTSRVNWYVNDTSTAGDSWVTAIGSDVTGQGTISSPFRTIVRAMQLATAGDTIFVDAGLYDSYVTISATETAGVNIDKDSITLIGVDSGVSVINPPGPNTQAYGIFADTQVNLFIKNIGITGAAEGIQFVNVDLSTITLDSMAFLANYGVDLKTGSETNTVKNNVASNITNYGIFLTASSGNTVTNNIANSNTIGISLQGSASNNTLTGNTANSHSQYGFYIFNASNNNTITGNTANSNNLSGIYLQSSSNNNTLTGNTANSNMNYGVILDGSSNNTISGDTTGSNAIAGIALQASANSNAIRNNVVKTNTQTGISIASSDTNAVVLNEIAGNDTGVKISGSAAGNLISKNNISAGVSAVYNAAGIAQTLTRNWWGTAQESLISAKFTDTSSVFKPYRLGLVDTTVGADTTAPGIPGNFAVVDTSVAGQIKLQWTIPTLNEETNGGAVAYGGFRIYRLTGVPDTTSWADAGLFTSSNATDTQYTDTTGIASLTTYYYRITAKDTASPFVNTSFFADTISVTTQYFGPVWYVNDTRTAADSFTYAGGSDTSSGIGNAASPYRTITKALSRAKSGDTILVDAGAYGETVVIDTDNIALIGKDSGATVIDPPGANSVVDLRGIYADTQIGITIRNLAVTGAYDGIFFYNVDNSYVQNDSSSSNGNMGICMRVGSDTNTISGGIFNFNGGAGSSYGICIFPNSNNNTISNNTTNSNTGDGIYLESNSNNRVLANTANLNSVHGVDLFLGSNHTVIGNMAKSNANAGVYVSSSDTHILVQNDISGNDTGVSIAGSSRNNVITKNNITGNTTTNVYNSAGLAQTLTRNWFGSADELAISAKFSDTASAFRPYRFGPVDTAAGADTTAPALPTAVTVDTSGGSSVVFTWAAPAINEETNGGAVAFGGLKFYRLVNIVDTTFWSNPAILVRTTLPGDTTWTDTNVSVGVTYYYRITSFDTAAPQNQSFFTSDTKIAVVVVPAWSGPVWYVDKDTGADTYTGHPNYPFKTIAKALQFIPADTQQFDTILIDRNTYGETVVIDTDYIWLEGVDSATSVIDPPGANTAAGLYAIFADTQSNLVIRNLGVTGALDGIRFENVDSSIVTMDSASSNGRDGISLLFGSDSNIVTKNTAAFDSGAGIALILSLADSINSNTLSNNDTGIYLVGATNITISNNLAVNSSKYGIHLQSASNNTVSNNSVTNNSWDGINLTAASNNNTIQDNIFANNSNSGINFWNAHINTVRRNLAYGHSSGAAIHLTDADTNEFYQNESRTNQYGVWIEQTGGNPSQNNKFIRNNIIKPDSYGIFIGNGQTDTPFFWRNFLDTTNTGLPTDNIVTSKTLFGLIWDGYDSGGLAKTGDTQFRFTMVDTTATGDSLAPNTPASLIIADSCAGSVRIRWTTPGANEAGYGASGHSGYRIYRTTNPALTDIRGNAFLASSAAATDTEYTDNTVTNGLTYYYRVTAVDTAAVPNESYFTDSAVGLPGGAFCDLGSMTVFVSDSGTSSQPTADSPLAAFPAIDSALIQLTPANGFDTIVVFKSIKDSYTIMTGMSLDTGITLISRKALFGVDNGGGGDTAPTLTWNAGSGVMLTVDSGARIDGFTLDGRDSSISVKLVSINFSDSVGTLRAVIRNSTMRNAAYGVFAGANAKDIQVNTCTMAAFSQAAVQFSAGGPTVVNCRIDNVTGTTAATAILQPSGGSAMIIDNIIRNSNRGIRLNAGAVQVFRNTIQNMTAEGIDLQASASSQVYGNDILNCDTGVVFGASASNAEARWNNILNSATSHVSFGVASAIFKNNYYGTTDSSVIEPKIKLGAASANGYAPYRFAMIDTRVSGDSVAPDKPETVTVNTSAPNQVGLTWTAPSLDDDGSQPDTNGQYKIFRLVNQADSPNWSAALYATSTTISFTDASVSAGNTYYYRVAAMDAAGNLGVMAPPKNTVPNFSNGDTVVIVSGNHQVGVSGGAISLVMDVKDTMTGQLIPAASVSLDVSYEGGTATSLSPVTTDAAGRCTATISLSSGDGVYLITASVRPGQADDAIFVVYTDKRKVNASKWTMIAPMKSPDSVTVSGLNQLSSSGGGTLLSYEYDPAISSPDATFGRFRSVTGQASPNASPNTFSQYKSGHGYWIKSTAATGIGLAGTTATVTDTFRVRLESTGAYMIGNPFTHYIDWLDDVAVDTSAAGTAPIKLRILTSSAVIDTNLQWRDQGAEQYLNPFGSGDTTVQLKPWVGVWLKVNSSCTLVFYPNKRVPQTARVKQASAKYGEVASADVSSWRMRVMAYSGVSEIRDEYTYVGVAPAAQDGTDMNDVWKAPGMLGDLQVLVGEASAAGQAAAVGAAQYGASIASPVKTAVSWPVEVRGPTGPVTLKWDAGGLPQGYGAYLVGGPEGPVDMSKASSAQMVLASAAHRTLVVGLPEYLVAFLASPLSADQSFAYPNPGPDAAGNVTFKYNLQAAGDVTLKIFDVGGKLVKELKESGAAGSNTTLKWDGTNANGQKVGSGVYIYIMEGAGNKLTDKLAIVR